MTKPERGIATKRRKRHKRLLVNFVSFCGQFPSALLCLALILANEHAWGQKAAKELVLPSSNMTFMTRLERTAVWPCDQFHYLIIVDFHCYYEFVLDNLTKEIVNMYTFQVIYVGK